MLLRQQTKLVAYVALAYSVLVKVTDDDAIGTDAEVILADIQ